MSDAFKSAAISQKENTRALHSPRKRPVMFSGEGVLTNLRRERLKDMAFRGYSEIKRRDGEVMVFHNSECVAFPDGTMYPKIEYIMDRLGADYVTQRIRAAGIDWKNSKSVMAYKDLREELLTEAINGKTNL
jgi:hypothetical protein